MNKKTNSIVFMLVATVVNIILTLVCMFLLFVIYAKFLAPILPADSAAWGVPIIFIAAIALSFIIYRAGIKLFSKKVDVEKHFDPLFGGRKRQIKKD